MSTHKITTGITVTFPINDEGERDSAQPKLEITYTYQPGSPGCMYQRNGDPGWPPEAPEVEVVSVKVLDADGIGFFGNETQEWETRAQDWLDDEGFDLACEHAEAGRMPDPDDLADMRREDAE